MLKLSVLRWCHRGVSR